MATNWRLQHLKTLCEEFCQTDMSWDYFSGQVKLLLIELDQENTKVKHRLAAAIAAGLDREGTNI